MPNLINELITKEIEENVSSSEGMILVSLTGLSVAESDGLRTALSEHGLRLRMVRNRLAHRSLEAKGFSFPAEVFVGNLGCCWGDAEDTIHAAKVLHTSPERKAGKVALRGGVLEGNVLSESEAVALASLPGRDELRAKLLGTIIAPAPAHRRAAQRSPGCPGARHPGPRRRGRRSRLSGRRSRLSGRRSHRITLRPRRARASSHGSRRILITPKSRDSPRRTPCPKKRTSPSSIPRSRELAGQLDNLTLLQASQLVKHLEDKWGVSSAAPVAMAAAPAGGGGEAAAEEKTAFDVILESAGDKKIQVIKEVRAITGLGLKESKDLVDGLPKPVKEGCSKEEAEDIKGKLEAAGGTVKVD